MYTEPLLIWTGRGLDLSAMAFRSLQGALLIGLPFAVLSAVVYSIATTPSAALLGLFMLGPFVADATRFVLLSARPGLLLFAYELVALVSQLTLLTAIPKVVGGDWVSYLSVWSASTLVAPVVFGLVIRRTIHPGQRLTEADRRSVAKSASAFGVDYALGALSLQATLWSATLVAGLGASAALRGADTLVGPFRVLLQTLPAMLLRRWSAANATSRHVAALKTTALLMLPLFAGGGALLAIPDSVGLQILGESWVVVRPIMPFVLVALIPITLSQISLLALKASGHSALLIHIRAIVVPVTVVSGVLGALLGAALGAAIGSLIGSTIAALIYFGALVRSEQEKDSKDD
jgi:O-antigen/teichoic acid export membrane protein